MSEFHILIFDEVIGDNFLRKKIYPHAVQMMDDTPFSIAEKPLLSDLPLWANFKVHDLIDKCYPDDIPTTIFSVREKDATSRLIELLKDGELGDHIILGRTGNVTAVEWENLVRKAVCQNEPLKIQVGKVPSDLYMVRRSYLQRVLKRYERESVNIAKWLFDTHLFHNFERIVDVPGFSFLMRNSYEYYRENMHIFDYMKSERFLDLYRRLAPNSQKSSAVLENGVVRDTVLGSGVNIEGTVERSVIFSDVTVGKNSVIRDSVILTANVIEEDVMVEYTLLFEGNGRVIGNGSFVGSEENVFNGFCPEMIKRGLTVVGPDIPVPPLSRIGAGCLVMGAVGSLGNPILMGNGELFDGKTEDLSINASN
jgi:carbonic anhydrase/acetyltransferase-like protein (isoleucine patch superfamily)